MDVSIFDASINSLSHRTETMIGDFNLFDAEEEIISVECRIRTSFLYLFSGKKFYGCSLQACFRFLCVVHPQKFFYNDVKFNLC